MRAVQVPLAVGGVPAPDSYPAALEVSPPPAPPTSSTTLMQTRAPSR